MSVLLTNPLASLGGADADELAIEIFSGLVLSNFQLESVVWPMIAKRTITAGNSVTFPAIGNMGFIEHTPGQDLPGTSEPLTEERTVPVDQKEIVAHTWVSRVQQLLAHFDFMQAYASEAGKTIATAIDSRVLRMIGLGARQASTGGGAFASGCLVRRNVADLETAYPITSTGADNLEADLIELGKKFSERNIKRGYRYAFVSPHVMSVAALHDEAVNRDFTDINANARVKVQVKELGGFTLIETNQLGTTGMGNIAVGESAYQGNFTATAVLAVADPMAVGAVMFGGIDTFGPKYYEEKRSTLLGAAFYGGAKWLRKEACGEIYASTSAYS